MINDEDDLENYVATAECDDDSAIPLCTKSNADTNMLNTQGALLGRIFAREDSANMCSTLANPNTLYDEDDSDSYPYLPSTNPKISASTEKCSNLAHGLVYGTIDLTAGATLPAAEDMVMGNTNVGNACTFEKEANLCKHLFPYFPKKSVTVDDKTVNLSDDALGDGKFTLKEKQFWGADPTVISTNGSGKKDEANVMGLGVDSFEWTYTTGDEIGVVVEGTSNLATEHNDSSYRTMWAFSKGTCPALKEIESEASIDTEKRSFYTEENGSIGILTANFDLDKCLEDNLISPEDDGAGSTMSIDLTATPDKPINDPSGIASDSVTVVASVKNVTDLSNMYYTWKIEKTSDGTAILTNDTSWVDITSDMMDTYDSLSSANQQGIGKNSLSFLLNLPEEVIDPKGNGVFYLRVRVTAAENSGTGNQTGNGMIIIKVQQQENQIVAYSVIAGDDGDLRLNNGIGTTPICNSAEELNTCYTTQNKIIGLVIPNTDKDLSGFSWKVNNVSVSCDASVSAASCSGSDNNTMFIPILGNIGESVYVVANAVSKKSSSTVEITRYFVIVEPQVVITSSDTTNIWPKLLGYYKNTDGDRTPDYSSQVFETNLGKTIALDAVVYSSWGQSSTFSWTIDGEMQNNNSNQLSFSVDKAAGNSYNIGLLLTAEHTAEIDKQKNNLRKALLKNWGASPETEENENISANIQVDVVDTSSVALSSPSKTGIFASLITNLPENLMFLLKIVLTSFVFIFSMSLLFAFIPESIFEKNGKANM